MTVGTGWQKHMVQVQQSPENELPVNVLSFSSLFHSYMLNLAPFFSSRLAKFSQLSTWTGPPMIVDGLEELVVPETPVFATDGAPPPPPSSL